MTTDLLAQTLAELTLRRGQWPSICRATGLDYDWLTKLAQGRIADPGVRKIQRLAIHFQAFPIITAGQIATKNVADEGTNV